MANDDEAIACGPLAQFMNALTDPFDRRMVATHIDGGKDGRAGRPRLRARQQLHYGRP